MKHHILPLCFLTLFIVSILCSCEKHLQPTTVVVHDPVRHYYPVLQGEPLVITYEMEDTTDFPIFIQEVQTSCGCIVPRSELPITILPHKRGTLQLSFNTIKNSGYVHHYVYCYGNFADSAAIVLEFDTNIVPHADYFHDYEELWTEQQRTLSPRDLMRNTGEKKGYYTDSPSDDVHSTTTRKIQRTIDHYTP